MHNRASNLVTGIYRSKDSIKNLKIRIRLEKEKLSLVAVHQDDSEDDDGHRIEEREFSWQEKVFSPFEASYYRFSGNCHSPLEEKYHEEVVLLWEKGPPVKRLFTYTDMDRFTGDDELQGKVKCHAHPSMLEDDAVKQSAVLPTRRRHRLYPKYNVVDYCPSEDMLRRNHTLQSAGQVFYILADLSTANICSAEVDWAGKLEYILCTLRWDSSNGVLTVTPDFSPDPYLIEVDEDSRSLYRYWVTHASDGITQEERDCEKELVNKLTDHHLNIRQLQIGTEFDMPEHGMLSVFLMGEIMYAENFEVDPLFINFFMELPRGWSCDTPEHLTGVTHVCYTNREDVVNFGYTFQLKLSYNLDHLQIEPEILPVGPQMFLEVVSCDGWGRSCSEGYGSFRLPSSPGRHKITVPTWRPKPTSITCQLRRFFLGGSPELLSPSHCGVPSDLQGPVMSKYALPTITTGNVILYLNVIHQSHALAGQNGSHSKNAALMERLSSATLVSSVNSVLLAFRRARESMLEARNALQAT